MVSFLTKCPSFLAPIREYRYKLTACDNTEITLSCATNYRLRVDAVFYGRNDDATCAEDSTLDYDTRCAARDPKNQLAARCDGQRQCKFQLQESLLSNNGWSQSCNRRTRYYLNTTYSCVLGPIETVWSCPAMPVTIRCPSSQFIVPVDAFYGREASPRAQEVCPGQNGAAPAACRQDNARLIFALQCARRTECRVQPDWFGEACVSDNYMRLEYQCSGAEDDYVDSEYPVQVGKQVGQAMCLLWAYSGECERNKAWMHANCYGTCFCGDKM